MVALQNSPNSLLHKKNTKKNTLNYRQRPYFRGAGGGAGSRLNSRVEYLLCPSFSLPLCHPQAWPTLARVILGRDEQEKYETWRENKHILAKKRCFFPFLFNITIKTSSRICVPRQMRAKPALRFTGTCLKRVVGLKMSLLESGKGIMLLWTVQLLCYMYARQMLNLPCTLLLLPSNISFCYNYSLRPQKTHLHPIIVLQFRLQYSKRVRNESWSSFCHSPQMLCRGRSGVSLMSLRFSWKLQLLVDMRACMCVCERAQRLLCCSCGLLTLP